MTQLHGLCHFKGSRLPHFADLVRQKCWEMGCSIAASLHHGLPHHAAVWLASVVLCEVETPTGPSAGEPRHRHVFRCFRGCSLCCRNFLPQLILEQRLFKYAGQWCRVAHAGRGATRVFVCIIEYTFHVAISSLSLHSEVMME